MPYQGSSAQFPLLFTHRLADGKRDGFMLSLRVLAPNKMQTASLSPFLKTITVTLHTRPSNMWQVVLSCMLPAARNNLWPFNINKVKSMLKLTHMLFVSVSKV